MTTPGPAPPPGGYLYYPGCSLRSTGVAYEESLLTLFRLLGLPMEELEDWNCCGATSYMSIDEGAAFVMASRNLALARQQGACDLVAPCSACYLVLRKAQDYSRQYPAIRERTARALSQAELGSLDAVRVRHPLEVLYVDVGLDRIRARVVRRWRAGPVACYYGCQAVRPFGEVDDAHHPMRMDELLRAVGVPTVEYALKTKCCGGTLTGTIRPVGLRLNYILLKEAARKAAEAVVTICPLCQFNLDVSQPEIRRETHEPLDLPIVYLTQVLGWALGGDPRALGLRRAISGRDWIRRWLLEPEKAEAYV